ncbi:MAG: dihydroneopterin aldolase [bacterium]
MKTTSLMKLKIENAVYYAYHGVKVEEKKIGGKYEVDLELWYDATKAIINDDVSEALNYEEAMFCISEVINGEESYDLIETICNEILNMLMERFDYLQKGTCRVRKLNVPLRRYVDYVEAEQSIERTA